MSLYSRLRSLTAVSCLAACSSGASSPDPSLDGGTDATADSGPPVVFPLPCGDLFDPEQVLVFEVEIAKEEWDALVADYLAQDPDKPYHPITFRYGDEFVSDAAIRYKGSSRTPELEPKMSFAISFNEITKGGRFHGLRRIKLDADSFVLERVADWYVREQLGLPASCSNSVRLMINGEYYGLFTNVEAVNKDFLKRNFDDPDGNLYKYGTILKTNEEVADTSDIGEWHATEDIRELEGITDLDQAVREWAAEAMLPAHDGYWAANENFYLYHHATRGFVFIPWDLDEAFLDGPPDAHPIWWRVDWFDPTPQFDAAIADPTWRGKYLGALRAAHDAYDVPAMLAKVDEWAEQIDEFAQDDPNDVYAIYQQKLADLRAHLGPRKAFMTDWLDCAMRGGDGDNDGFDCISDCFDANENAFPGSAEECNGLDDDCNLVIDDTYACGGCEQEFLGGVWFSFCTLELAWDRAVTECERLGGSLAVPLSDAEQAFLVGKATEIAPDKSWWIGATDAAEEGTWTDLEGTPLSFTAWSGAGTNGGTEENCAIIDLSVGGGWKDRPCEEREPAICRLP